MRQIQHNDFIFPGMRGPLSNMALLTLLGRMNHDDLTEQTRFSSEVVEMALAHVVEDKTGAAYRRGDLLEKRRKLMDAWAGY
jgi:hypothetical protein